MDIIWLQIILLFLGTIFIIIALFKPKDDLIIEEKTEKILEDFISQMDIENEEILKKIKKSQKDFSLQMDEKLNKLEQRLESMEQENYRSPQFNKKYEQIFNLYQAGDSVDSIAKKMQMGHGEIELVLELFKKGFKYV